MRGRTTPKLGRLRSNNGRRFLWFGVALITGLLLILIQFEPVKAQSNSRLQETSQEISPTLPTPQVHPLPPSLREWYDPTVAGDYFSEIKLTPVGYLVWFEFPVKVYVEQPTDSAESSASAKRFHHWVDAVLQAVQEWNVYLPLEVVSQPEGADISILRSRPPIRAAFNRETGQFDLPRARSAEARYEFYLRPSLEEAKDVLAQKFTIHLSPDQTLEYTLATARHELGHALGIWGHSPVETDALYFSQVRNPPGISVRDINTLKRIYKQPTRLGWTLLSRRVKIQWLQGFDSTS